MTLFPKWFDRAVRPNHHGGNRTGCQLRGRRHAAAAALILATALSGCATFGVEIPRSISGAFVAPASIASDCTRDVTNELQAWLGSVPDYSRLEFTPHGCYRLDGTLKIVNRHGLTFEGRGALFWVFTNGRELPPRQARTRVQFRFTFGSDIVVRDILVRGANPNAGTGEAAYVADLEAQHAFEAGGVQGLLLDHVQATDVYGDFVYIGAPSRYVTVRNSTFARNGRQGWTVSGGEDIVFDHNSITDTRRATIDMEANSVEAATRRITFSNNAIGPGRLFLLSQHGAAAPSEDVAFLGNRLSGRALTIHVIGAPGSRSRYRVIGNTSDAGASQQGGGVIYFAGVTGVEVRDNLQPVQPLRGISGVGLLDSRNVEVAGNRFPDAIAPIFLDTGNTNVHDVGNFIGNPLQLSPERTIPQT